MRKLYAFKTMLAAMVFAVGLTLSATDARAILIFEGSGTCVVGCTTDTEAYWELTVADTYTPGTDLTVADYVDFTYGSDNFSVLPGSITVSLLSGVLPVSGPAAGNVFLIGLIDESQISLLVTLSDGLWSAALGWSAYDSGIDGTWGQYQYVTAVSEPSALWLFLIGLGLLAAGLVGVPRHRMT